MAKSSSKAAICFFTHVFNASLRRRYEKLKKDISGRAEVFILAEKGAPIPASLAAETHFFEFGRLRTKAACVVDDKLVPGSFHLAFLDFQESHPGFDYYWFVEYDVVFTGDWNTLFDGVEDDRSDLIAGHVRGYDDERSWYWWLTMNFPGCEKKSDWLRAFFPIFRISSRGLQAVARQVKNGWSGHYEGIVPTAVRFAGLSLCELGGDGPWTPESRRHRFYVSVSSSAGEMLFGTLRCMPAHFLPHYWRDAIFHPVKERRTPTLEDLRKMRQKLGLLFKKDVARSWVKSFYYLLADSAACRRSK